jgi:hypothetical protein
MDIYIDDVLVGMAASFAIAQNIVCQITDGVVFARYAC